MRTIFAVLAIGLLLCSGCSKNGESHFKGDFCELVPRQATFTNGVEVVVSMLKPDDVLVAVNGYPLTKKMFDDISVLKAREISNRKGSNSAYANNQLAEFQKNYVTLFINQRLLIDQAYALKVIPKDELERRVNEAVQKQAAARKISVQKLVDTFPGDFRYALYDISSMMLMNALISKHIPPVGEVSDELVAAFQEAIKSDIEAAAKTNEMTRAAMLGWKNDILTNKVSFTELAKNYDQDDWADSEKPGYWGEFERGEIEDKRVQSAVFSLKVGEISDPVEDDDGFHLIRVLSIKPPELNEKGRVVQDEIRKVEHIYVKKLPILIQDADDILKADLKRQMQLQAVNAYLENLKTNGLNRIEFPHGQHLFE